MVREKGLEPSRLWLDTGTSSLPVYLFQHSRVSRAKAIIAETADLSTGFFRIFCPGEKPLHFMLDKRRVIVYYDMAFSGFETCRISGCSAAGSVLGSGPRGRGFKSRHSDHEMQGSPLMGLLCFIIPRADFRRFGWPTCSKA